MKLGPQSKLENENTMTSEKFEDHIISANYDV